MVRESREMVLAYFKHYQSGVWRVRELRVSLSGVVFKNTRRRHLRPGTSCSACRRVCVSQRNAPHLQWSPPPAIWPGPGAMRGIARAPAIVSLFEPVYARSCPLYIYFPSK